jgi:hypothetical protein
MKPSTKPLKGPTISSNVGTFDTIIANNVLLENISVVGLLEDSIFVNVTIKDSELINTVIGAGGANVGYFTNLYTNQNVNFQSNQFGSYVNWDPTTSIFNIMNGTLKVDGCSFLGNLEICENYINAVNPNGDITLKPNGIGTIYLNGPIYNTASTGNFYSEIKNGSFTVTSLENINLQSSSGSFNLSTLKDQTFTTKNGDISLNTENVSNLNISSINSTNGSTRITTSLNHNLRPGDIITLSNTGVIDNKYTVGNILSNNSFLLTTNTSIGSTIITKGNLIKTLSNNILLNTLSLVKIPENTDLTFGTTTNSISGNTQSLLISSNADISMIMPTSKSFIIPQNTFIDFGSVSSTLGNSNITSGNYINHDGSSLNIIGTNNIKVNSQSLQINSTNTSFYDPILTISNYTTGSFDRKDKGIEYKYFNTQSNTMATGWFGYKASTNKFTFIPNATNNGEVISGTPGEFEIGNVSANNVTIAAGATFDVNCGQLINVNTITGCGGIINVNATNNLNITSGNRISLIANNDIYIPNNIPITLGTSGSNLVEKTSGNLQFTASKNISLLTQTNGSIIIPINTNLSFDGTSIGNQKINSNTNGDLLISSNKNLYLNLTNGNIIIPSNNDGISTKSSLQFGNSSEIIYGNTNGINIITNSSLGSLNLLSQKDTNISNSNGNITLRPLTGDIQLYTTLGNVRLLPTSRLIFNITGTQNSIRIDTIGNLVINGDTTKSIELKNTQNISLIASSDINIQTPSNINISSGTYVNLSQDKSRYIVADTLGSFLLTNNLSNGSIILTSLNTTINNTNGTLSAVNSTTTISTNTLTISGTTGSIVNFNTENVKFRDPIISLADYTLISNDLKDRGVEFNYFTSGSMVNAWFGFKNSTGRFTYYSNAINTNEIISGTIGQVQFDSAYLTNSLNFTGNGNINMNCGTISNLNTIIGCTGTVNIIGSNNVNISSNNILLQAGSKVQLPYNIPLSFGNTTNTISADSNGTMTITALGGSGTVVLNSNVQINGTTSSVYSTITNIQDPIFSLGGVTGPLLNDLKDRGIEFKWNNGIAGTAGSKTGFFGYKNNLGRFVFIKDGINVDEIYSGTYSDVQFGNGYLTNLDLANGTISNVNTISGGRINIIATSDSISLSSGNTILPYNSKLSFGSTSNSISADTSGNLNIYSTKDTNITSQTGNINFSVNTNGSFISLPQNVPLYFGSNTSIISNSSGNLDISNSNGNINLIPKLSSGNINIPTNTFLNFTDSNTTRNSLLSDGQQLFVNGYQGVNINTSTFTISGNVNVIGSITADVGTNFDINSYILPLGTSQILNIQSIQSISGYTSGSTLVTVNTNHNFTIGDSIKLTNTTSVPTIDGTYTIRTIPNSTSFIISSANILSPSGVGGTVKSNLTTYQGKDVGIQVNYWTTVGNTSLTSGSAGYKTGFFGYKNSSQRWTYYNNATISNNIVTGTLSDIEVNKVFTNNMSGFILDGAISAGSNSIAGSNFQISGGAINSTPIGVNTAQTGRFTNLSNTVSASFQNVTLTSSLAYTFERYTLSTSGLQTRNPSSSYVISMFSVTGTNYITSSGTMPSNSVNIQDGTFKILTCSSMGIGCRHTIYFGENKLITPNPLNTNAQATKLIFKRQGQTAQLVFDAQGNNNNGAWILLNSGVYVE